MNVATSRASSDERGWRGTYPNLRWCHVAYANTSSFLEISQTTREAQQTELGGMVQWRGDCSVVACDAAYEDQTSSLFLLGPVPNGHLRQSDGRREIHIKLHVMPRLSIRIVARRRFRVRLCAGSFPEGRRAWLKDTSACYDNVDTLGKGLGRKIPESLQIGPGTDVGAVEVAGGRAVGGVLGEEGFGFGTECEVGDDNRAAFAEEEANKTEVDS